jgi:hypothetical protein
VAAAKCQSCLVDPALVQRLITFHVYFWGFLVLDRQDFFGTPPPPMETFTMALGLGVAVVLLPPLVAKLLPQRMSGRRR